MNKLEKWKAEQKEQLPQWFDALKEFEAVLSFSTLYYNNKDWIFPTITENKQLHAVQICLLYTSPSPRDRTRSRMPSSA